MSKRIQITQILGNNQSMRTSTLAVCTRPYFSPFRSVAFPLCEKFDQGTRLAVLLSLTQNHLLLNPPLHTHDVNPSLSVIIPAHNGTLYHRWLLLVFLHYYYFFSHPETHFLYPGYTPMMQLDCEVLNTKIFHMQTP